MVALAANLSAEQEWIPLSATDALSLPVGYYTIDTENVFVDTGAHRADSISRPTYDGRRARRGVGGSTAATHLSGATLTAYDPEAPSGDGGGSGIPQGGPLTEDLDADGNQVHNVEVITGVDSNAVEFTTGISVDGNRIQFVADPDNPQDAATKAYVDAANPLTSVTVNLSAGQIATLNSVPVQVVAAPGVGKVIVPVSVTLQFQAGATPYETAIPEIRLGTQGIGIMFSDAGLDGADDTVSSLSSVGLGHVQADVANQPLRLTADLDPDTDGDGTARLTVLYYVMDLAV